MPISSSRGESQIPVNDGVGALVSLALFGGVLYLGYLFVTAVVPVMAVLGWQLVLGAFSASSLSGELALSNLGYDVLVGFGAGVVIGLLRYVLFVRKRVVEDIVDAMATPDVVSVSKAGLGLVWVAWHALAGALAGVILGWLGMIQFPQFFTGHLSALPTSAGSAIQLMAANGFFRGGGGPPPEGAEPFLAWLVILLLTFIAIVFVTLLLTVAIAWFGSALASGFAGGAAKSLGINVVLVLTRLWQESVSVRPRRTAGQELPVLVLEEEMSRFIAMDRLAAPNDYAPSAIDEYLSWLERKRQPLTVAAAIRKREDYRKSLKSRKSPLPSILSDFFSYLPHGKPDDAPLASLIPLFLEEKAANLKSFDGRVQQWSEQVRELREKTRLLLDSYWAWLTTFGEPVGVEAAVERAAVYEASLPMTDRNLFRSFISGLDVQVRIRQPRPATDFSRDVLPDHVIYPGWMRDVLLQGLWIGFITAVLNALASAICLLVANTQLLRA